MLARVLLEERKLNVHKRMGRGEALKYLTAIYEEAWN